MWYTRRSWAWRVKSRGSFSNFGEELKGIFFCQSSVNGEQNENVGIRVIAKLVSV